MRIVQLSAALATAILLASSLATAAAQTNAPMPIAQVSFAQILEDAGRAFSVAPLQGNISVGYGAVRNGARVYPSASFASMSGASFHRGVDYPAAEGAAIVAPGPGRVSRIELNHSGYGMWLEVDHGQGLLTRYAHLSAIDVRVDQTVAAGQVLAHVGHTGAVSDPAHPHLHFEVLSMRMHPGAEYFINPESVLPPAGAR